MAREWQADYYVYQASTALDGSTEAEHAMATGTLQLRKPRSMRVSFELSPKDVRYFRERLRARQKGSGARDEGRVLANPCETCLA